MHLGPNLCRVVTSRFLQNLLWPKDLGWAMYAELLLARNQVEVTYLKVVYCSLTALW